MELTPGGRVRVEVQGRRSDDSALCQVIDGRGRVLQSFPLPDGIGTSPPLSEGAAILRIQSDQSATQFLTAQVIIGETTPARFIEKPGLRRTIELSRTDGSQVRFRTTATVTDAQGNIHFHTADLRRTRAFEKSNSIDLEGLQGGSYRLQILDPSGVSHDSWINVDNSEDDTIALQLDW